MMEKFSAEMAKTNEKKNRARFKKIVRDPKKKSGS